MSLITDNKRNGENRPNETHKGQPPDLKSLIYYHRAYRKIPDAGRYILLKYLILIAPFLVAVLLVYPDLTLIMSKFAKYTLMSSSSDSIEILNKPYMLRNIYLLVPPTKYPSPLFTYIIFLFSLSGIVLTTRKIKIAKPIALWIAFLSSINLLSSIFFILAPTLFPYNAGEFSDLYIKTQINIWLFIPVIMGMTLLPLPSGYLPKFLVISATLLYSIIFGVVRYGVFLYTIAKFSLLFMPVLFFNFGPLMDFFYIVSGYSLYVSILSKKTGRDIKVWNWSY